MLKHSFRLFLRGLAAMLPLALTLYFIFWLLTLLERTMQPLLELLIPVSWYFPGLGILVGCVLLFAAGIVVNAYVVQHIINYSGRIIERIPLVKSLYSALRDFTDLLTTERNQPPQSVVALDVGNNTHMIGFVTGANAGAALFKDNEFSDNGESELVGVYFPMSYQIGGYTLYVERSRLRVLDIGFEDAMRLVLTGGVHRKPDEADPAAPPPPIFGQM